MLHVIIGPPCAGKSTHVQENAADGDVVVDFDALAAALGSSTSHAAEGPVREAAFAARAAVIDGLLDDPEIEAWVIHTRPSKDDVGKYDAAGAEFVLLDPGVDVCMERAKERPDGTADVILDWYADPPQIPNAAIDELEEPPAEHTKGRGGTVRTKTMAINHARVKAGPEDGLNEGEFLVYPSTFTREPDSYGDVVAPTAFDRDMAERKAAGHVLPGLFGHRMDDPDFYVAYAIDEGVDEHGWWVKGAFDLEDVKAAKTYRLVKGRRIRELSFAFETFSEGQVTLADGRKANELRDVGVFEFSFVPIGANRDTSVVAVKALAESLVDGVKSGRVLSAKNEDELRTAHDAIGRVLKALEQPTTDDDSKASDTDPAHDETPSGRKSLEPSRQSSAALLAHLELAAGELELIES